LEALVTDGHEIGFVPTWHANLSYTSNVQAAARERAMNTKQENQMPTIAEGMNPGQSISTEDSSLLVIDRKTETVVYFENVDASPSSMPSSLPSPCPPIHPEIRTRSNSPK
jgi:hypothetical protein